MKKKIFGVFISILVIGIIAACGNSSTSDENTEEENTQEEESEKVLRAGSTAQSYPNGYEEDGELVGFDVEVFETIADNLGYSVEWVKADFAGLMGQLETGRIDTIANVVAITPERLEAYNFTEPYSYAGVTIVTHEDNDYEEVEELYGKSVSGVLGSNNVKNLNEHHPDIEAKTYETRDGAMNDAINKRVDGYVNTKTSLIAEIDKGDLPLKFVGDPFTYEEIGFPFLKNEEGDQMIELFNEELEKLRNDGTLKEISEKYFAGEDISVKD